MVIALSHSGTTAEVLAAARHLRARGLPVYAITGAGAEPSPLLGLCAGKALTYRLPEAAAEPYGGAPTCSVVCMESLANALVCAAAAARGFDQPAFKRNHPGGALGQCL